MLSENQLISPLTLRKVGGAFATGVTVLTIVHDDQTQGMTANSFLSVSLDPALVLVSIQKNARLHTLLSPDVKMGISILRAEQKDASEFFAGRHHVINYKPLFESNKDGWQTLENSLGWYHTTIHQLVDAGDHTLVICKVHDLGRTTGNPLIYYSGYSQLA